MALLPRPQGFIVTRWAAEFDEARAQLAAWMADGKILQGALAQFSRWVRNTHAIQRHRADPRLQQLRGRLAV